MSQEIRREISPKLYSAEEFAGKVSDGNSFVRNVIDGQKIFLKGDEHGLSPLDVLRGSVMRYDEAMAPVDAAWEAAQ